MRSYLQQLENNEAILLMYLAGELPEADRQEVEQMLASDATLRRELEILRQTQQLAYDSLQSLDDLTRPALRPGEATNRISRIIAVWLANRRQALVRELAGRSPVPWWRIGFAAAAMLLVGYYIWAVYDRLDHHNPGTNSPSSVAPSDEMADSDLPTARQPRPLSDDEKVALLSNSLEDSNSAESDLHVAEVAAVMPGDSENPDVIHADSVQTDSGQTNLGQGETGGSADSNGVNQP